DKESLESKRSRKRKISRSRRPGKRKISETKDVEEQQQHDQNVGNTPNDLTQDSSYIKSVHKNHNKSQGVKNIIINAEGDKREEPKGIKASKREGHLRKKGRKRGDRKPRRKGKGRKGRKNKTRDKGLLHENAINEVTSNVKVLEETQNKEGIIRNTTVLTTKSRRKSRKGRHKGSKEERRKERRERRRRKKKQSEEENRRKQPIEVSTVTSSTSIFNDEENQLNNDLIPNQNIKSFDTILNSSTVSTTNYVVEPITKASTIFANRTSEISFVPSDYHKDSTYSPVEPEYTIEGSKIEETIVDIVQDISAISNNKGDNILIHSNIDRNDDGPTQINTIDVTKNINTLKVKAENQRKDIKANIVKSLLQKENSNNEIDNDYLEYDEENDDDYSNMEDLPEGYPLDRLKKMGILPEGYLEEALQEVDDSDSSRFIETEEIDFGELDISCVISKSDSMYIPLPIAKNAHVSSY
ncbi:unnamed protein product, partial [Meganyctiphanes norvegica]